MNLLEELNFKNPDLSSASFIGLCVFDPGQIICMQVRKQQIELAEKPGKLEVGGASRDSTGLGALEEGLISS